MELKYFKTSMAYTYNIYDEPSASSNLLSEDKKLLGSTSKKSRYGSFTLPSDTSRTMEEYICKSGDTLAGVALRFDTSIENLKKLNKHLYYASSTSLQPGDKLFVSVKKLQLPQATFQKQQKQPDGLDQHQYEQHEKIATTAIGLNFNENDQNQRRRGTPADFKSSKSRLKNSEDQIKSINLSKSSTRCSSSNFNKTEHVSLDFINNNKSQNDKSNFNNDTDRQMRLSDNDNSNHGNSKCNDDNNKSKSNKPCNKLLKIKNDKISTTSITDFLSSFDKSLSSLKENVSRIEKSSVLKNEEDGMSNAERFTIEDDIF